MIRRFVRLINNRVVETFDQEGSTKKECAELFKEYITKKHHENYFNYFLDTPLSDNADPSDEYRGGKFYKYDPTPEEVQEKETRSAKQKIDRLQSKVLWKLLQYVDSQADCPQEIKDLKEEIEEARGKL